jgi:hypothetical protein
MIDDIKERYKTLHATNFSEMTEDAKLQKTYDSETILKESWPFRDIRSALDSAANLKDVKFHLSGK